MVDFHEMVKLGDFFKCRKCHLVVRTEAEVAEHVASNQVRVD